MADNKSIATRDSYGAALLELADAGHDDIVVFDADCPLRPVPQYLQKNILNAFLTAALPSATWSV